MASGRRPHEPEANMAFFLRYAVILALFAIPSSARAQEPQEPDRSPRLGAGIVCDTPQQVERYLSLHVAGTPPHSALQTVNTEFHNPVACGILVTAFIETQEIAKVNIAKGILRLVQITVLATMGETGWQRVPATVQYTAMFVKTEEV
jgi:hypothetical protein